MIPKTLHIIWIGDQAKRPDNCIRTWVERNPDATVSLLRALIECGTSR